MRGSLTRHLLLAPALEGLVLLPGFTLAGLLFGQLLPDRTPLDGVPVLVTFLSTYGLGRYAADRWGRTRAARRETALPFEHWLDLTRTNPEQARQFLSAYLARARLDGTDPVAQLRAACASLEDSHHGDPIVHGALTTLREEITRFQQERTR